LLAYYTCDVTSNDTVSELFTRFMPTLRTPIRGLVNCVGVSENWPVVDFPTDRFKRLFDINVAGTFIVAQAVAREVIKAGVSASMVFIGSISGSVSNRVGPLLLR
jgi:NAD(P)-dependent dehydrogenase (short-subunit alcohol dehydrogenase family)